MEKVVYILGAGFSAPAGLPVMQNFLSRSRDMLLNIENKYIQHKGIFETIKELHYAKTYFNTDLQNIEEILSILQMQAAVSQDMSAESKAKSFEDYIKDVIRYYTPDISRLAIPRQISYSDFTDYMVPSGRHVIFNYARFVSQLLNMRWVYKNAMGEISKGYDGSYSWSKIMVDQLAYEFDDNSYTKYSVVTLNYDLLLENSIKQLGLFCQPNEGEPELSKEKLELAKLHGSIDANLVPPTWRKHTSSDYDSIEKALRKAHDLLSSATKIRILGYSLPVSDNYMRYLLESAVIKSENLKEIDIISLDSKDKKLEKRYKDFISFSGMRFCNANIAHYLGISKIEAGKYHPIDKMQITINEEEAILSLPSLELHHEKFMKENQSS